MVKQLSSLDMHFLLEEFKELEGSKVDRVYNKGKEEIYIQLYKSNAGKRVLRVIMGKAVFLTQDKAADETPSGFCMALRNKLEGRFLELVEQLRPERILEFVFKSKEGIKKVYLEFFGKGNVILCSEDDVIIDSLIRHKFRDRYILPKEKYKHPQMEYNLFSLQESQLKEMLKKSEKDKIVTCLAVELGLGGVYSEEVCLLSGINKDTMPRKINENLASKIVDSIKKVIKNKKNPQIAYQDKKAVDAVPMDLEFYKDYERKRFSSFNEALDEYFTKEVKLEKKEETAYEKKINELKRIIGEQKETIGSMEKKEAENRKKAEMIYNNYSLIKEVLDEINKASKKYSWEDIKKKLKEHKVVKDVDVKEKKVVVEV
ncbi:NFACT family protein [Candidatus Woesearchaeota archaeon]|nr:NFACT family protein [Candidatus Woesearchaeota archaeon]